MNYASIKAVILDFDGVLTSNTVYVSESGSEIVRCNRSDGIGISLLKKSGICVVVISSEINRVVVARCNKLQVECFHAVNDKVLTAKSWLSKKNISLAESAFIGNDINDISLLKSVGFPFCPGDAHESVKSLSTQLRANGGMGVVRELSDKLVLRRILRYV